MGSFSSRLPGHQEAIAVCLHIQTQQIVNDSLCDMVHRPPAMSQACNTEPCPPRYVLPYAERREMLSGQQHPPKRNSLCTETHRLISVDQPSRSELLFAKISLWPQLIWSIFKSKAEFLLSLPFICIKNPWAQTGLLF